MNQGVDDRILWVLPFEMNGAREALSKCVKQQQKLAEEMTEVMSQGSEAWLDSNMPAGSILIETEVLTAKATEIKRDMHRMSEVKYADANSNVVALGSIVTLRYPDKQDTVKILLTGYTTDLSDGIRSKYEEKFGKFFVATYNSPVGCAIFGKMVEDETAIILPNKSTRVNIVSIEQFNPEAQ